MFPRSCAQIFSPSCTFFLSFRISQISPHQLMVTDVSSLKTSSVSLSTRLLHRELHVCAFILLCGFLWKCYLIQHFSQTVNETSAQKVLTLYLSSCYTLYKCSTLRSLTELKPLPHGTASLFVSFRWMPSYCSVHMCWLRGGPRRYGAHIPAQGRPDLKSPASIEIHSSAARFNLFRSSPPQKNKNN